MQGKTLFAISILGLLSACGSGNSKKLKEDSAENTIVDTILIKAENPREGFAKDFYAKSYSYYWVAGQDTVHLPLQATARKEDGAVVLATTVDSVALFSTMLRKLQQALPTIAVDFELAELSSFYFRTPIYYPDLALELGKEYEQQFGEKEIAYAELNDFLMGSSLTVKLNQALEPLDKKVKRYNIEKFHFTSLNPAFEGDYRQLLPHVDPSEYPQLIIHGMGLSVEIIAR